MANLSGTEAVAVKSMLTQPAENLGNDPTLEFHWAMKAYHHAETYFNILTAIDPKPLKLTQIDDEILERFETEMPDVRIDVLDEEQLKSKEGKEQWRNFCNQFKEQVEDWNMGTLLRLDCNEGVSDKNTTLVPRIQFLAIEIARNRRGLNDGLKEKFKTDKCQMESSN